MNGKKKIIVNGKEYARLEDIPPLEILRDPAFQKSRPITSYVIEGKEYKRLEDVPEKFRAFLQDADRNGIPDMMEENLPTDVEAQREHSLSSHAHPTSFGTASSANHFSRVIGNIVLGAALVLSLLYWLFWRR